MEPFCTLTAVAAPFGMVNVDTDQVTPARFLWRARRDGYADVLFHDLRRNDDGSPKADFVLNRPEFDGAQILVADRNFGCGSSREHAVWALHDAGFRAVIAPSFGDIFFNNSFKNGLLPIRLTGERVAALRAALERAPGSRVTADLEAQQVIGPDGTIDRFDIDPLRKQLLLEGIDDIEFTLRHADAIAAFEAEYEREAP